MGRQHTVARRVNTARLMGLLPGTGEETKRKTTLGAWPRNKARLPISPVTPSGKVARESDWIWCDVAILLKRFIPNAIYIAKALDLVLVYHTIKPVSHRRRDTVVLYILSDNQTMIPCSVPMYLARSGRSANPFATTVTQSFGKRSNCRAKDSTVTMKGTN
jgi:hypothetical protein